MILCFPNFDALRLALTTGAVPPEMAQKPVAFALDEKGRLWLQPAVEPSRAALAELGRLGVQPAKSSPAATEKVLCWPQLFPLQRTTQAPVPSEKAPVLFDLPSVQLPELVAEMLRLGNDRQSFRHLENGAAERVLLRVIGPPYYSLLRAIDRDGREDAPLAYVECAPRVWVQLGYQHPLGGQFKPREGQVLLMRPPRQWTLLDDAPFRDIYEVIEFPLPQAKVGWREGKLPGRLQVPLRLGTGSGTDVAELWVLHERPFEQLDALVQAAAEELLGRLDFAVGDRGEQQVIVLRVRPSRQPPPVLQLEQAVEFRRHAGLRNLYLPVGRLLQPRLRRDVLRSLLADDPGTVTWLYPREGGTFVPESLPDAVFRELRHWIDYVLDHDRKELELWVQSTLFDFEPFVCKDDQPARPKPPTAGRPRATRRQPTGEPAGGQPEPEPPPKEKPRHRQEEADQDFAQAVKAEPNVLEQQLRELEEQFLRLQEPPARVEKERQALWPRMAELNAALGNIDDAGLCWMNALWAEDQLPPQKPWHWFETEAKAVPARQEKGQPQPRSWAETPGRMAEVSGANLDRLLAISEPNAADVRALAAYLAWAAHRSPSAVLQRLNRLRLFLEKHEDLIPVRAVWLAWVGLARLSGGDVLVLARARDRLLERLFKHGLRPEQDLPLFLRFAGQPTMERSRTLHRWMPRLRQLAHRWIQLNSPKSPLTSELPRTEEYADLMFAFGLARLGEPKASLALLEKAQQSLAEGKDVHSFLLQAYAHRIRQVLEGKPHGGPLPVEHMEYLEHMAPTARYVVDRLRHHSRILEPDQKVEPYRYNKARDEVEVELAKLPDVLDRDDLVKRIRSLIGRARKNLSVQAAVLQVSLDQTPRIGEAFALELLALLPPLFHVLPAPEDREDFRRQASLLERGLFVAAHFDQAEQVQRLVARFGQLLELPNPQLVEALDSLAEECFRGLRKLGMRDEIDRLLTQMAQRLLQGRDLQALDADGAAENLAALRALLHVADGWFYFGREKQAVRVLNLARTVLLRHGPEESLADVSLGGNVSREQRTLLACTYATVLTRVPAGLAQSRLEEMFHRLRGIRDTYTTYEYYGRLQLQVVEAVVLAVTGESFRMGADARRWLDDDEFLIRRRIHHDVRTMMTV